MSDPVSLPAFDVVTVFYFSHLDGYFGCLFKSKEFRRVEFTATWHQQVGQTSLGASRPHIYSLYFLK